MSVELLEDAFPHGTVQGHEAGCRGRICPGREAYGWSCAEAVVRFRGDWGFRKRVMAGMSAADIAAEEAAVREEERRVAKAARRAERAAQRRPGRVATKRIHPGTGPSSRATSWTPADVAKLRELAEEGLKVCEIADRIGRPKSSVSTKRRELGFAPRAGWRHGTRTGYERGCTGDGCPVSPSCGEVGRAYFLKQYHLRKARARELQEKAS